MRILFVCGKNLRRSPTAEALYRNDPRVQARSAGVSDKARRRVRSGDLLWADLILVMESKHAARLREAWREAEPCDAYGEVTADDSLHPDANGLHASNLPRVECLDIPDEFEFGDPELVELLKQSVEPWLTDVEGPPEGT
ncbi:phosphotyrosine protein phosphatase [Verrucomicrobia bacterium LW23]|nr:phosphotyrosine protein phosphatase [Verrucomicrobia bacterium LW23]